MLEFEFWQHIEHFPNRSPMDGLLEQIMGELNYMKIGTFSIIIIYPRMLMAYTRVRCYYFGGYDSSI